MSALKRLWRWLQQPEEDAALLRQAELQSAYQLGHHNGFWSGVLHGRKALIEELETELAARGQGLAEITSADVLRMKGKLVH